MAALLGSTCLIVVVLGARILTVAEPPEATELTTALLHLSVHAGVPIAAGIALVSGRRTVVAGAALVAIGAWAALGAVDHLAHAVFARHIDVALGVAAAADLLVAAAASIVVVVASSGPVASRGKLRDVRRGSPRVLLIVGVVLLAVGIPSWPWRAVGAAITQPTSSVALIAAPTGWLRVTALLGVLVLIALGYLAATLHNGLAAASITGVIAAVGGRELAEAVVVRRVWEGSMTVEPFVWLGVHAAGLVLVLLAVGAIVRGTETG
jgi:hypothetical protein